MTASVHCSHCGAPFGVQDARFCSFCGTERPAERAPAPNASLAPLAPNAPERFDAAQRDPRLPDLQRRTPTAKGETAYGFCGVLFFLGFGAIALTIAASAVGVSWFGARSTGASELRIGGVLFALVPLAMLGVAAAGLVQHLRRTSRFQAAELERWIALVVDERTQVSGGKRAHSRYYATLEDRSGKRRELRVGTELAGQIARDDMGLAYVKDDLLLDFERLDARDRR